MAADMSGVARLGGLMPGLEILLGREINFIKSPAEVGSYLGHYLPAGRQVPPALLDNVRQNPGEEKNDPEFAKQLVAGFDLYVNNSFPVSHLDHVSFLSWHKLLPSYAA